MTEENKSHLSEDEYELVAENALGLIGGALDACVQIHIRMVLPERAEAVEADTTPIIAGALSAVVRFAIDPERPEKDGEFADALCSIIRDEVQHTRFDIISSRANAVGQGRA